MTNAKNYRQSLPMLGILATIFTLPMMVPSAGLADEPLPRGQFRVNGVEVVAINRTQADGKTIDEESDKLTHWIRFDIRPDFELIEGSEQQPFEIVNPTVRLHTSLTLDKAIKFEGVEVPAGTNLMDYQEFDGSRYNISMPDLTPLAIHSVRIHKGFEFPADTYTLTFAWTTSEDQVISDEVTVHIDVELED